MKNRGSRSFSVLNFQSTLFPIILLTILIFIAWSSNEKNNINLWYDKPASDWMSEALPIGNGYMGAMVFGGIDEERIQLNEESLWAGGPGTGASYYGGNRPGAYKFLPQVRQLLKEQKYAEAHDLANRELTGIIHNERVKFRFGDYGAYQNFADIFIKVENKGEAAEYYRDLDLSEAIANVRYKAGGINYQRCYFASYPDRMMVFNLSSDDPDGTDYFISIKIPHPKSEQIFDNNMLVVTGELEDNGMKFELRMLVRLKKGRISYGYQGIKISRANQVTLLITAATDYLPKYPNYTGRDYVALNKKTMEEASKKSDKELFERHVADYQELFNRVDLNLGNSELVNLTMPQRIKQYHEGAADLQLEALYFQFGRYLLISSSRPGTLPANLQGKWNDKIDPPWACDYHTNINLQMNYWLAEVTNLSECHQSLLDYIETLREPGQVSAREHFNARGWIVNTMNNPFGFTAPGWNFPWGFFPGGAAWLCQHLWEHYAFSMDTDYLRNQAFPIMKEAAQFWLDYLVEDDDGTLVSAPSYSPEQGGISKGASMDHQMVWDLFTNFIAACEVLGINDSFKDSVATALKKLCPPRIGRWGQLQEWKEDIDDPSNNHRHVSHLFALHPGKQISLQKTPELAEAAKVSLQARGDGGTGWSRAWKINFWARLQDGDHAYKMLRTLLRPTADHGFDYINAGGTYDNLFCAHPPFQIDGNFGATAGIAEMLVQSHADEIHLLPALPATWPRGKVKGLCARGGFVIDLYWQDGVLAQVKIYSKNGNDCRIRYRDNAITFQTKAGESYSFDDTLVKK